MNARVSKYWFYQGVGWGLFIFINAFFASTFDKFNAIFSGRLVIFVGLGICFSHLMRHAIIRSSLLIKPLQLQLIGFVLITVTFAMATGSLESLLTRLFYLRTYQEKTFTETKIIISNTFSSFVYFFMWNCIYFIYHFVEKNRRQQVDTLKLEALVRELELKTIKAHINPHFIFNALNSIRALIDENPGRARTAVTELSNILRSSMQAEKMETVPFEKELNIVKDYLALEYMRFEDRLRIEYDIDDGTLEQPVPPMMLQTLVENAIKHGISKELAGGTVKVSSSFRNNYHEMKVLNTGSLDGDRNGEGFGLASTENRLQLMFGDKAHFYINEIKGDMVEAKIQIPRTTSFA